MLTFDDAQPQPTETHSSASSQGLLSETRTDTNPTDPFNRIHPFKHQERGYQLPPAQLSWLEFAVLQFPLLLLAASIDSEPNRIVVTIIISITAGLASLIFTNWFGPFQKIPLDAGLDGGITSIVGIR